MTLIFDGHNDVLSRLWCGSDDPVDDFARPTGHISAPACRAGGMGGGFFAMFSPGARQAFDFTSFSGGKINFDLPPAMAQDAALASVMAQAGLAQRLQDAGHIRICTDAGQLARSFVGPELAAVLHLEGADCIDEDLLVLDALYAIGLRSLGLVWSRPNAFAQGVPFKHWRDGDTGPGLSGPGKKLVARCKALGVMIDTSHLTMKGFWDVAEAGLPLVATHSNAHVLCQSTRNLTDAQLKAVRETGGMVGLNFATLFLSDKGWETGQAGIGDCIRQLDHLIGVAGEDHVGLGSDFDGAPLPDGIASAADLPKLVQAMQDHGYGAALIAKLCHENWLGYVSARLGPGT